MSELLPKFGHLPLRIQPQFSTTTPNEPIILYSGPLELHRGDVVFKGTGSVRFDWLG